MLAADAIRLTEETVRELRAQGLDERARALESILSVATAALGASAPGRPPQYLTAAQAARLLGGEVQLIRQLVARGEIQAEHLGGRLLIGRDALLAYLTQAASEPNPPTVSTPEQLAAADRRRKFIMKGLPPEDLVRLEALHDKLETEQKLSRAERAEMIALERLVIDAAGRRLEEWTAQRRASLL
jgi:excisionase family DNA binding protein